MLSWHLTSFDLACLNIGRALEMDIPGSIGCKRVPSVDQRQQVKLRSFAQPNERGKRALEDLDHACVLTMGPVMYVERSSRTARVPTGQGR
jgi:hypothetical protein